MKKTFLKFLLPALALGLMAGSLLRAEDEVGPPAGAPPPPPGDQPPARGGGRRGGPGGGRGGMMDPAQQIQRLDEALKLTDDQKTKITAIFKKQGDDMRALMGGGAGGPPSEETRAKMMDIQKATHDQIRALLTDDQQKKFDAMPAPQGPGGRRGGGGQRKKE